MRFFFLLIVTASHFCFAQDMKNVLFLDNWTDTSFNAGLEDVRFNEIVGFQSNGQSFVVIGSWKGAHFLQIKNQQLHFVDFVPGKFQNITAINRDYAVYQNYLYAVCDEGTSSLQIMDLSYLPDSIHVVYDSSTLFTTAHTVCIDTLNAKLYACGTNLAAMQLFDLTNPQAPVWISDFSGATYVHDCHVVNDTAFLNCGYDGLKIYNFSGPVPVQLGMLDFYPNQGYNHSGYFADSRKRYAFTDETEGTKIKLCDLTNLAGITVDQEFGTFEYADHVPHELILLENLLFCAYYNEGLRIFDLSDYPVREIGSYDTYTANSNYKLNGAWGVTIFKEQNLIAISDRQSGAFLFYFPIQQLEANVNNGTYVTNTPFIDGNRILIPRPHLKIDELFFTISSANGSVVYNQENYLNWVQIPLDLNPGTYIYAIFSDENTLVESGKFVIGN